MTNYKETLSTRRHGALAANHYFVSIRFSSVPGVNASFATALSSSTRESSSMICAHWPCPREPRLDYGTKTGECRLDRSGCVNSGSRRFAVKTRRPRCSTDRNARAVPFPAGAPWRLIVTANVIEREPQEVRVANDRYDVLYRLELVEIRNSRVQQQWCDGPLEAPAKIVLVAAIEGFLRHPIRVTQVTVGVGRDGELLRKSSVEQWIDLRRSGPKRHVVPVAMRVDRRRHDVHHFAGRASMENTAP